MAPASAPAPALVAANKASTATWQADLENLFDHAKDRFPDVVWTLLSDGKDQGEEVWGHKAMVYARAPPSFQQRYFSFRPAPIASPMPYAPSPVDGQRAANSSLSLAISLGEASPAQTPSPFRAPSPAPSQTLGSIMRLTTTISPALFSHEVEYLYTGKGMGAAFEFLFDSQDQQEPGDAEDQRVEKLRKDLVYMWRARLYSDVRIALTGHVPSTPVPNAEGTMPVFSSHRFILVSRSPYFRSQLLSGFAPPPPANYSSPITLELPGSAFTPASLHFTLGYLYTGTLSFSHRTYDLDTAFAMVRSALYLQLEVLYTEVEARIVEEMLHGLFHAFLSFDEYEKITGGKWGIGGCKCRQCQRRAPRVLNFSLADDVKNKILERGSRRALVGMFGEGWATPEFAHLPTKVRLNLIKGVVNRTTPANIINLLFAYQAAMKKLDASTDVWVDSVREMVLKVRQRIDEVMCTQCAECFEQREWVELLESDGAKFGDAEKVGWVMESIRRGLADANAGIVYQTLVSSIILRPHPVEVGQTLLPNNSNIRALVEETRIEIIAWLRKHWVSVRLAAGFDSLDGWALKELSHELDVALENLISSSPGASKDLPNRSGKHLTVGDAETSSMTSVRVATKNGRTRPTPSIVSSIRSGVSRHTAASTTTPSTSAARSSVRVVSPLPMSSRSNAPSINSPDTPNTPRLLSSNFGRSGTSSTTASGPSNPSTSNSHLVTFSTDDVPPVPKITPSPPKAVTARKDVQNSIVSAADSFSSSARPKSSAASVRSTTSTVRTLGGTGGPPAAASSSKTKPPPSPSRASSRASTRSEASMATAKSTLQPPRTVRPRKSSTASSVASNTSTTAKSSTRTPITPSAPKPLRPRRSSAASTTSSVSPSVRPKRPSGASINDSKSAAGAKSPTTPGALKRPPSAASVRSTVSTTTIERKRAISGKAAEKVPELPKKPIISKSSTTPVPTPSASSTANAKGKGKAVVSNGLSSPPETDTKPSSIDKSPSPQILTKLRTDLSSSTPSSPRSKLNGHSREHSESGSEIVSPTSTIGRSDGTSTVRAIRLDRRNSTDTITGASSTISASTLRPIVSRVTSQRPLPAPPPDSATTSHARSQMMTTPKRGITLNVGIPCIISSKRTRFRAFARYIGEVDGENGPWVGVEVPVAESWSGDKLEGRDWNDGTWGGIRYFEIGSGPEWEDHEERAARRRRLDWVNSGGKNGLPPAAAMGSKKREGEQLNIERAKRFRSASPAVSDVSTSESRGLFVRPQQVLYVVDAVGGE